MQARYQFRTDVTAASRLVRFDTGASNGVPAAVCNSGGTPIAQPIVLQPGGGIPTVFAETDAPLFVRALDWLGNTVEGVVATVTALDTQPPPPDTLAVDLAARLAASNAQGKADVAAAAAAAITSGVPESFDQFAEVLLRVVANETADVAEVARALAAESTLTDQINQKVSAWKPAETVLAGAARLLPNGRVGLAVQDFTTGSVVDYTKWVLAQPGPLVVAVADASLAEQIAADVVLPATGIAAALAACFTTARPHVKLVGQGKTLQLNADVTISGVDFAHLELGPGLIVQARANQGQSTGTDTGAVTIAGAAPTQLTFAPVDASWPAGERTFAHSTTGLAGQVAVGDRVQLRSTEVHNNNRPSQFFKGEVQRVVAVSDIGITFATGLRDTYDTSKLTVFKMNLLRAPRVTFGAGSKIQSHPGSTSAYGQLLMLRDCLHAQVFQPWIDGGALQSACVGIGIWRSINARIIDPVLDRVADLLNTGSPLGYGIYAAGVEGLYVQSPRGTQCRHVYDAGTGGNNAYGQSRYHVIEAGRGDRCYAAAWSTHDAEHVTFVDCVAFSCGGGFISRSPGTRIVRPVVRGTHIDNPGYTIGHQSTTHGIYVGEPDAGQTTGAGRGGENLIVEDPDIDMRNGATAIAAAAIYAVDPLINATIEGDLPLLPTRDGIWCASDGNTGSRIRVTVDGQAQLAAASRTGCTWTLKSGSTAASQGHVDNDVTLKVRNLNANAFAIAGGTGTGSSDRNRINVTVQSLAAATATTKVVAFSGTAFTGTDLEVHSPATLITALAGNAPAGTFWRKSRAANNAVAQTRPELSAPVSTSYLPLRAGAATTTNQAVTSGRETYVELEIPDQRTWDKFGCVIATAEVVASGSTIRQLTLYPDMGGRPDLSTPISRATLNMSAAGTVQTTFTGTPPPGKYWVGFYYNTNGATITTAPLVLGAAGAVGAPGGTPGTTYRGMQLTGLSAAPVDNSQTPATFAGTDLLVATLRAA